jgi:hypothetical protein
VSEPPSSPGGSPYDHYQYSPAKNETVYYSEDGTAVDVHSGPPPQTPPEMNY